MKKSDTITLVVIAIIALMASFFIINALFAQKQPNQAKVKTIDPISPGLPEISKDIFHKDSINPAVQVFIGKEGQ